jgi:calcium-dependent protein kinase
MFATKNEDSPIKMIDFGLARHDDASNHGTMTTRVGTPYYISPEVLAGEYTRSCDMWSIGVITHILLSGCPPFDGDTDHQIFESVKLGFFNFSAPEWDDVSSAAKDFIRCLLRRDPSKRLTASEALSHPWIVCSSSTRIARRLSSCSAHHSLVLVPRVAAPDASLIGIYQNAWSALVTLIQ